MRGPKIVGPRYNSMRCMDPVLCHTDQKGKRKFRNFSLASPIFIGQLHQTVFNCGRCIYCRKRRAYELAVRCVLHASLYQENCFLTLTYDESREDYSNELCYEHIQNFKKCLRAKCMRDSGRRISAFNVHEYGKRGKKHWHVIVFNWAPVDRELHTWSGGLPLWRSATLEKLWSYGFSTVGDVSEASALYQAQYQQKDFKNGNALNSRKSHSRHSGIGRPYFYRHYVQLLRLGFIPFAGRRLPLPRYFEKLAHKHYAHFYELSAFHDTATRRALHRPFRGSDQPNKEIADLFKVYRERRKETIAELETEWEAFLDSFVFKSTPDFKKSGVNYLHDLRQKTGVDIF